MKCIYGVLASELVSNGVDCGSEPWPGQFKDYKLVLVAPALSTQHPIYNLKLDHCFYIMSSDVLVYYLTGSLS